MPRLLIVTTVPDAIRAFLLPYAHYFRARGWRVDAAARGISCDMACHRAFDRTHEIGWSRHTSSCTEMWTAVRQVQAIVREGRYDIVHVHTPVAAFLTRFALRRSDAAGPAVIYTAHGFHFHEHGSSWTNLLFQILEKIAGQWTDHLVVITRDDEAAALRHRLVPENRLWYMPGIGVDTTLYRAEAVPQRAVEDVRRELRLRADDPLFLMIAEFNPGKRHRDALRAFAFASLRQRSAHLAFAGVGPLRQRIEQLARRLGLGDCVHFLGFRQEISALIRASVATLLPSEREGLPRSILESLSLSVPAIGANIRGIRELLMDGAGLLVEVGDVDGLTRAMTAILDDPGGARAMGRRGREKVAQYDVTHLLKLHADLYAEASPVCRYETALQENA